MEQTAINKRFTQTLDAIAEFSRLYALACVSLLYIGLRVPVVTVTLNKQIKPRDVKVEHETRANREFTLMFYQALLKRLSNYLLNRGLARKATIASERAESRPPTLNPIWRSPESLAAFCTIQNHRRATADLRAVRSILSGGVVKASTAPSAFSVLAEREHLTLQRAETITRGIGYGHRKHTLAARAHFAHAVGSAGVRAEPSNGPSARITKSFATALACQRCGLAASFPHDVCGAGSATPAPRWALRGYKLFAAIRASVNVLFSHGVNLRHRLAFWSEPFRVFQHLGGSLILSQVAQ